MTIVNINIGDAGRVEVSINLFILLEILRYLAWIHSRKDVLDAYIFYETWFKLKDRCGIICPLDGIVVILRMIT